MTQHLQQIGLAAESQPMVAVVAGRPFHAGESRRRPGKADLRQTGFTLIEMLIAMAVTLLMMAAIARGFAFVGERIRDSRANVEMSTELLDLTTRLRSELERCTATLTPNTGEPDQAGYFLYYEGPVTDATSSLFRTAGTPSNPVLPDSRYGDFDDYLAFTAVAPPNSWFTGKVPRYLLDQRMANLAGSSYTLPSGPYSSANPDPFEPVVIRSKYAEVIYFACPEYLPSSLPANPTYIDVDGNTDLGSGSASENGLPDRLRIHRRVLLIRPDLNLSNGILPIQVNGTVPFMQPDNWPTAGGATITTGAVANDAWLYGMAAVHQQCDLSVRRVLDNNGQPTATVAANSLTDLSQPHNRFAHVRVPNAILTGGGGSVPTSMPVLALGPPATILNAVNVGSSVRLAPPPSPNVGPVVTPSRLSGFLRPEFVLGFDLTHRDVSGDAWGLERIGEDLLVNNALSLDIRIFDPDATSFTTTTGLVVSPGDAGYREALLDAVLDTAASATRGEFRGAYVDLCYPVLAGGSLRGWQGRHLDRISTVAPQAIGIANAYLVTPFSGVAGYAAGNTSINAYTNSLYRSGRLVTTGTDIRLFQPAFDTYSSAYERDGFLQARSGGEGVKWTSTIDLSADLGSDGIDNDSQFGADDLGEHETQPPFLARPASIQITVRLENPSTRQMRQLSVVHQAVR